MKSNSHIVQLLSDVECLPHENVATDLSYNQMHLLADTYCRWATEAEVDVEHAVSLIKWARGMRLLAGVVGKDWNPPEPKRLSLLGFIARKCEEAS